MKLNVLILLSTMVGSVAALGAAPKNVLFIIVDDLRPKLGCYGDVYATSPHIDSIAAQGMRYLNAWSTAPVHGHSRSEAWHP